MRLKVIMLLAILILAGGCKPAGYGRIESESLTSDETAIPPGRYQQGVDMYHRGHVRLNSPRTKPTLLWSITPEVTIDATNVLVDSEGGVWYPDGEAGMLSTYNLIRLNPDGSVDFEKNMLPDALVGMGRGEGGLQAEVGFSIIYPALMCEGAIIARLDRWIASAEFGTEEPEAKESGYACLECVDLDGRTRWRTEPIEGMQVDQDAWRLPQDIVAMPASKTSFNMYSLEDGSLIESRDVPGWSVYNIPGPLQTDDDGWIFNGDNWRDRTEDATFPFIERISPDGQVVWHKEYSEWSFALPMTINEEGIIARGNRYGLEFIDSSNGSVLLSKYSATNELCGVTRDGNFIVAGCDNENDRASVRVLDTAGNVIWSIDGRVHGDNDVVVYEDGGILLGHSYGITLLNRDGSVRWRVDFNDLGLSSEDWTGRWSVNPQPDGGIVAFASVHNHRYRGMIFALGRSSE